MENLLEGFLKKIIYTFILKRAPGHGSVSGCKNRLCLSCTSSSWASAVPPCCTVQMGHLGSCLQTWTCVRDCIISMYGLAMSPFHGTCGTSDVCRPTHCWGWFRHRTHFCPLSRPVCAEEDESFQEELLTPHHLRSTLPIPIFYFRFESPQAGQLSLL